MAGRPTKLTASVQKAICKALEDGNTRQDAAQLTGVGASTMSSWLALGRKQKTGQFREFLEAIKKAETVAVNNAIKCITRAARKDWKAAAWYVERKRQRHFGRVDRVEHTGKKGQPIKTKVTHDVTAELAAYADAFRVFALSITGSIAGASNGPVGPAVLRDGTGEPLDTPQAQPEAGDLPPA